MRSSNKNGVPTDAVHVDTGAAFNVIQVDIAILGDQEDYTMLFAYLKQYYHCLLDHSSYQIDIIKSHVK